MKIENTGKCDLGLDQETVIPAGQSVEIDNDILTIHKENPVVKSWFVDGKLVEHGAVEVAKPAKSFKRARTDKGNSK